MITQYFRPQSLEEALKLLAKRNTRPLGGGTVLNQHSDESFAVVDLQALGLDKIHKVGEKLEIGATVTLQALLESAHTPEALKQAIRLEAPLNLRNMGTVAGALVACDGRSPFAAVMLTLDAKLTVDGGRQTEGGPRSAIHGIGEILPVREESLRGKLITKIEIPLNTKLAYESVARTPTDKAIVCAALAQWKSGRTRLVVGGWGKAPSVAMDGNEPSGVEAAARNAAHEAMDEWASAEYRSDVAAVLAKRCLEKFSKDKS
jgi:putative selenate reductase FAD-binding subunit